MYFDTSSIILIAITFAASLLYYHYKNVYSYWKRKNINGPRPYYGVGNLLNLFVDSKFTKKCIKQYGRVYGIYESFKPILMVSDAELARQICIKDFDVFPNHTVHKFINEHNSKFLFELVDNHWRRVRALMTPSFTSGKMRKMVRLLDKCGDDLLASFEDQIDESKQKEAAVVDLKEMYCLYTLDAISTCCYAIKLTRAKSATSMKMLATRNELVAQAMEMFHYSLARVILMYMVNEKLLEWLKFEAVPMKRIRPLVTRISALINNRREIGQRKYDDLLQMMVDAKLDDQVELDEFDLKENHHAALTNESIQSDQAKMIAEAKRMSSNIDEKISNKTGCMSDDEILANSCNFLAVGIETTATFLTSCTYHLAFCPNVQQRLREEIRKITTFDDANNPSFDYDTLTSCSYLDAVVSEGLRLSAPVTLTDRVSCDDYYIEKLDLTLPRGSKIYLDWENIMTDEEYWPDPYKFDPERFMPENKSKIVPGSYCPFGLGSRHCIGMRFSLTESKLALAKMILKFQFEPAPGTKYPLENKPNFGLKHLINPVVSIKRVSK